jgi:hypothetical protein
MSRQDTDSLDIFLPATQRNVSKSFDACSMLPDILKAQLADQINDALRAKGIIIANSSDQPISAAQKGLTRAFSQAGGLSDTTKRALAKQVNQAVGRAYGNCGNL